MDMTIIVSHDNAGEAANKQYSNTLQCKRKGDLPSERNTSLFYVVYREREKHTGS